MSYYEALNLRSEPFSTSPDPRFFYPSSSHDAALKRLEIAIRLRRGLNVILGDVGTGKTTLSRMLIQLFQNEPDFIFHMVLDPSYKTEFQFLSSIAKMFGVTPLFRSTLDYKDALEKYLFQKGVDENKTIVLLIDEGQKLTPAQIEILRTLLNYETNEYKLLQLIIMSQIELLPKIRKIKNFMDRINLKYIINPLDEQETKKLISFRLRQAGYPQEQELFSDRAISRIYEHSQGYPRKISMVCHDAIEMLIMRDEKQVDGNIIEEIIAREVR
jgi:general secretion pathway protein A